MKKSDIFSKRKMFGDLISSKLETLEHVCSGSLKTPNFETLHFWNIEILKLRNLEILESLNLGILEFRILEVSAEQESSKEIMLPVYSLGFPDYSGSTSKSSKPGFSRSAYCSGQGLSASTTGWPVRS